MKEQRISFIPLKNCRGCTKSNSYGLLLIPQAFLFLFMFQNHQKPPQTPYIFTQTIRFWYGEFLRAIGTKGGWMNFLNKVLSLKLGFCPVRAYWSSLAADSSSRSLNSRVQVASTRHVGQQLTKFEAKKWMILEWNSYQEPGATILATFLVGTILRIWAAVYKAYPQNEIGSKAQLIMELTISNKVRLRPSAPPFNCSDLGGVNCEWILHSLR